MAWFAELARHTYALAEGMPAIIPTRQSFQCQVLRLEAMARGILMHRRHPEVRALARLEG
jgi:hypothetical protein